MFKNMKLSTKLIAGFLAVTVITGIIGLTGFFGLKTAKLQMHEIGDVYLPSVQYIERISKSLADLKGGLRGLLNPKLTVEQRQEQYACIQRARDEYKAAKDAYEPIPRDKEADKIYQQFLCSLAEWRAENDKFVNMCHELDELDITNPDALKERVETFRGDHYKLLDSVAGLVHNKTEFQGGEDHMACNFGKWNSTFKTKNPVISAALKEMTQAHEHFHVCVGKIKEQAKAGNADAETAAYRELGIAAEDIFKGF